MACPQYLGNYTVFLILNTGKDIALQILLFSIQRKDICEELVKSQKVFSEKLNHLSRRLAWINVTIYSKVRGNAVTF